MLWAPRLWFPRLLPVPGSGRLAQQRETAIPLFGDCEQDAARRNALLKQAGQRTTQHPVTATDASLAAFSRRNKAE